MSLLGLLEKENKIFTNFLFYCFMTAIITCLNLIAIKPTLTQTIDGICKI